ncbi:hypothetical protein SAMN05444141_103544 [Pseudovibrio denitrificans]|uniref:Uncharacterized protein n=1 Tax=Pseudovibrio denitrificans TaxID=258256 RepID=A0A1I7B1H6_9HYPH|nr:hypothetical protein SAMN05444141_103544 [Pseudovibrio denitrificans]
MQICAVSVQVIKAAMGKQPALVCRLLFYWDLASLSRFDITEELVDFVAEVICFRAELLRGDEDLL